ncbi:glycosyltransferase [Acinetobacter terrae]|uniref:Glycosyltransferase n=1 Tax=Acinetobacter terrae TaxID=2731247 RepID=A0A8E4F8R5_9GAMM|nr:glycosyltransferase [Acinetobacter terrae]NNH38935.1 glycosyltransferase [Acinetobacter terrae]
MSDQSPLVTVYIPTYKRVDLLKRAVESVRNQTYQNLEIIVVDDCSTDGTHEYLKEITTVDKRIRYFIKEQNSGACVSRNIAIENATGEYITGLDDDYFLENRIEVFIKNKELLNEFAFLYNRSLLDIKGRIKKQGGFSPKIIAKEYLLYLNFVGNQVFTLRSRLNEINGFDEQLAAWQDLDCWYRLLGNNTKAILLSESTYVMDANDRIRITNQNRLGKIEKVYHYLCAKYRLNEFEKKIFSNQMVGYGINVSMRNGIISNKYSFYFRSWFWLRFYYLAIKYLVQAKV